MIFKIIFLFVSEEVKVKSFLIPSDCSGSKVSPEVFKTVNLTNFWTKKLILTPVIFNFVLFVAYTEPSILLPSFLVIL